MQVQFQTADVAALYPDMFVSVRVGDAQKQARLNGLRTFNFPNGNENKFGRIELFQRVGVVSCNLECAEGVFQDLEVPCSSFTPTSSMVNVQFAVRGGTVPKEAAPGKNVEAKVKERRGAAEKYLADHALEESLAEAMRAVIHEKPSDPYAFLCETLTKLGAACKERKPPTTKKADDPPSALPGSQVPPVPVPPGPPATDNQLGKNAPPMINSQVASGVSGVQARLENFGQYYTAYFAPMDGRCLAGLYSKFPSQSSPKAQSSTVPTSGIKDIGVSPAINCSQSVAQPAPLSDKFDVYYRTNFAVLGNQVLVGLYDKFTIKKRPPALEAGVGAPAADLAAAPPTTPFAHSPSVGSWLARPSPNARRAVYLPGATAAESALGAKAAAPVEDCKFEMKPSVGTWLARPSVKRTASQSQVAERASLKPMAPFHQRASVGTWLFSPPPPLEPVDVSAENYTTLVSLPPAGIIAGFQSELRKKEAEIEELKRRLNAQSLG